MIGACLQVHCMRQAKQTALKGSAVKTKQVEYNAFDKWSVATTFLR